MKRQVLLELQWQGGGGKFRHLVLRPPGLRRVLGTFGIVVVLALTAASVVSVRSNRAVARFDVDTVLRENAVLKARQEALRERAFDLAEQLYGRVEQGRRMARLAATPAHAWEGQCPRPPARDAGNEAIIAWLSEQGTRLEALTGQLTAGQVDMGVKLASAPVPGRWDTVPVRNAAALQVADMGSDRRREALPTKR